MNSWPVFTYDEYDNYFSILKRGVWIGVIDGTDCTEHFVKWLVDLLNKNHAEYTKEHSEQLIREMGF